MAETPDYSPPLAPSPRAIADRFQWRAALSASLIAALVLLIVPRASPWSALTFFAPVIMGRVVPETLGIEPLVSKILHLALSLGYGLLISMLVMRVTQLRAIAVGALVGLGLYAANLLVVTLWIPELRGDEPVVAFSHAVFGGIAAGAYRGLRRPAVYPDDET